ncbi:hypothetical protein HPB50_013113 [Hyalomma asiaticum]|uniref:Uncharacterized protein n=1 Tax=Hyalomma asiaticum TaxID=266040 RepID=A0ACB7S8K4_HYAAI|nr:hypothetical protein HPB50_013113 [Hyalomma asiaticum]
MLLSLRVRIGVQLLARGLIGGQHPPSALCLTGAASAGGRKLPPRLSAAVACNVRAGCVSRRPLARHKGAPLIAAAAAFDTTPGILGLLYVGFGRRPRRPRNGGQRVRCS